MGLFKPKLNKDFQKRLDTLKPKVFIAVNHTGGLPIAENILCQLYYTDDKIVICESGNTFNLSLVQIQSIDIKTDVEINSQYVSSAAGAVGGAMLFGPVGALIGGRTKKKKTRKVKQYLIISYLSNQEIKYLAFDVTYTPKAREFVKLFNQSNKKENIVNL